MPIRRDMTDKADLKVTIDGSSRWNCNVLLVECAGKQYRITANEEGGIKLHAVQSTLLIKRAGNQVLCKQGSVFIE